MAVLDTNVLVDMMGRSSAVNTVKARTKAADLVRSGETLCTTRINVAELWVGIELANDRNGEAEASTFGQIIAHLRRQGRPSGDFDALIAAIAMANGHMVVTRNLKHFVDIPRLAIEGY